VDAEDLLAEIGRRIRAEIERKGASITVTAELAGITREYLHKVMAGKQALTIPKLYAVADALGVRPTDLLP
jgi:transcriptional regulator with XRE-family HTH domain